MLLRIELPLPPQKCWPNASGKLRDIMRDKRDAKEIGWGCAFDAIPNPPRWERVDARAIYTFRVRRTRDDDGMEGAAKWYRDQIARRLGIDDTNWRWIEMVEVVDRAAEPGVVIEVWERMGD